jgi:hypothetical protein
MIVQSLSSQLTNQRVLKCNNYLQNREKYYAKKNDPAQVFSEFIPSNVFGKGRFVIYHSYTQCPLP